MICRLVLLRGDFESATELFKLDFAGYLEVISVMEKSIEAELDYAKLSTAHALTQGFI